MQRNRALAITFGATPAVIDYVVNRRMLYICTNATNTSSVTVGDDTYGPGYQGPGSGVQLASITGTTGDGCTVVVDDA